MMLKRDRVRDLGGHGMVYWGPSFISSCNLKELLLFTLRYTIDYFTCTVMADCNAFFSGRLASNLSYVYSNSPAFCCSWLRLCSCSTPGDRARSSLGCNHRAVSYYYSTCFSVISQQPCLKPGLHLRQLSGSPLLFVEIYTCHSMSCAALAINN